MAKSKTTSKLAVSREREIAHDLYLAGLMQQMPDALISVDMETRIVEWNPASEKMYGWTASEVIGHEVREFIQTEYPQISREEMLRVVLEKGSWRGDTTQNRKDGLRFPVAASISLIKDKSGKPTGFVTINRDITRRKELETNLRESEDKYAALFYQASMPAVLLGLPERLAVDVNTAFENMSGYNRQEIIGKNPVQIGMAPTTETQRAFHEFEEKGSLFGVEGRFFNKTGDTRDVLINASALELNGKKFALITYQNITERKQTEEQLRQSEERFSKAFQSTPTALVLARVSDSKFEFVNDSFLKMVEYEPDEVIGKSPAELNLFPHPAELTGVREMLLATGKVRDLERTIRSKNGEFRNVTYSADIIQLNGEPYGLVTMVDITERRRAERQVLQMKRLYATLSQVNQTIVRVKDRADLYQSICDVSTKFGEFALAWIGLLNEATGDVVPVAASGVDLAKWPFPQINIYEGIFKDSLTATGLRTSNVVTSEDIFTDERTKSSRTVLDNQDYHAIAVVPFQLRGKTIGMLSLISHDANLFKAQEEALLLKEMGGDISFALDTMETEANRKQAEEHLRAQDIRLQILANASQSFAAAGQDYQGVVDQVVREIANTLADMCVIRMLSDDGKFLKLTAIYSRDPDFTQKLQQIDERTDDNGMAQYVFNTGKPALVPVITVEQLLASLPSEYEEIDLQFAPHSFIVVPLRVQGRSIGILALTRYRKEQPSFTEDDVAMAQDLSDRAALAINGAQLFDLARKELEVRKQAEQKVQEQLRRQKSLHTIDQAISTNTSMEETLNVVIQQTKELLAIDAVAILLVDEQEQLLECVACDGFKSLEVRNTQLKLSEGYAGRAVREKHTIHIPNLLETGSSLAESLETAGDNLLDYYSTPLLSKDNVLGVLEVYFHAPIHADKDWVTFFEMLAGQAAIAIENSQLFNGLMRVTEELEQRVKLRTSDLERANAELEHANRAKDEFLATMSHELRTPLTGILGLAETLQLGIYGQINEKQLSALQAIENSGRHLLDLINDILDLSKIEAGKFDIYPQIINLNDTCRASLAFVKELAQKKSVLLDYQEANQVKSVFADPRRLKQMLVNLLGNAVKFTPEKGKVTLSVHTDPEKEQIHFSVTDTGIGIAQADLDRLFTPFTQVDSRLNRQYEGTGLGLALVLRLAEMHGGSVQVESEVGQGSRFTVSLPWQPQVVTQSQTLNEPVQRSASEEIAPNSRGVLLLAEDSPTNVLTIGDYVQFKGYTLVVASNGMEALVKAEENNPDLILMDIQMPVMDGLEATRRLRANPRFASTPIIALTALAMNGDRERCLEAGATDYLSKPVSLKQLVEKINSLMQK